MALIYKILFNTVLVCSKYSGAMITVNIIAHKWILFYMQILGLHSVIKNKNSRRCYGIAVACVIFANYFIYFVLPEDHEDNLKTHFTLLLVEFFECQAKLENYLKLFYYINNFLFLAGTLLSLTAFIAVFTSILNHQLKEKIAKNIQIHDYSMSQAFETTSIYKKLKKDVAKDFATFFVIIWMVLIAYMMFTYFFSLNSIDYGWQYAIINHIIYIQCFQIFIYTSAIEKRLDVMSRIKLNMCSAIKLHKFKQGLIQLQDILCYAKKCFSFSLLFSYFWLYGSILSNLHWIGSSLLGITVSNYGGKYLGK